jgi:hypothetical protein
MDITKPAAYPTPKLPRWLFLSAVVMSGAALVAWWRRNSFRHEPVAIALPPVPEQTDLPPIVPATPRRPQLIPLIRTGARWLLFGLIATFLAWLLVNSTGPNLAMALVIVAAIISNRPRILAAASIGMMIESAYSFQSASKLAQLDVPTVRMLLAGVTLWMSMNLEWKVTRIPALPAPVEGMFPRMRFSQAHVGIVLLGVVALAELIRINAAPHFNGQHILDPIDTQVGLLVASITLIVAGVGNVRLPRRLPAIHWPTVLLVTGIVALALVVRFWELGERNRFFIDELFFADNVHMLRHSRMVSLLAPYDVVAAEPLLYPYWQSLTVGLFGRNFVGLRAASAIIGSITIGGVYLLGRSLFDRKTAILAALLLATFPPHIHFSRIGLSEIAMTLFGTLALAFLARGVISKRSFDFALGGAMLGMTHYFHEGGKYLYTPLAVIWLLAVWVLYRPRLSRRHLAIAGLTCLLAALPIYTTLLAAQKPLAARMAVNDAGLAGDYWRQLLQGGDLWRHVVEHVLPPFLIYIQQWDGTLFYGGHTPLVLVFLVPALLLGAFYVLRRWNAPGPLLLILWVLATALGNSLLVESNNAARFVVVFPGIMLLVAIGIRYTLLLLWPDEASPRLPPTLRRLNDRVRQVSPLIQPFTLLLVIMGISFSIQQVDYYFNQHLDAFNEQTRESWGRRDAEDAVLRSVNFPPGTQIHIIWQSREPNIQVTRGMLNFMADGLEVNAIESKYLSPAYLNTLDRRVDHAFYVAHDNTRAVSLLRDIFTLLPPEMSPYGLPPNQQFILYYAPADAQVNRSGAAP